MKIAVSLLFFFLSFLCVGQEYVVMYYNILWYHQDAERDESYLKILEEVNPDIVVAVELSNENDDDQFFTNVVKAYNQNFSKGEFHPSNNGRTGCDINIYYNRLLFELDKQHFIPSKPRDFALYELDIMDYPKNITIIGTHLKASNRPRFRQTRKNACHDLLTYLDENELASNIILGGDFNFYNASEAGYQLLVTEGAFIDPLGEGDWHDNEDFSAIHTQSTREGRRYGGLDDRFDFIFFTPDFQSGSGDFHYVEDSYTDFGNDGGDFNESINEGDNTEIAKEVADALYIASDHLPVILTFSLNRQE